MTGWPADIAAHEVEDHRKVFIAIVEYLRRLLKQQHLLLRLWYYRKTSGIIQDHSIIQIWILNPNS